MGLKDTFTKDSCLFGTHDIRPEDVVSSFDKIKREYHFKRTCSKCGYTWEDIIPIIKILFIFSGGESYVLEGFFKSF